MTTANQEGPAARPYATTGHDSIELIARDAASYAEGAGEPEFSQFLQVEARLLTLTRPACAQHEADLAEVTRQREALADALELALRMLEEVPARSWLNGTSDGGYPDDGEVLTARAFDDIRAALRAAGRLP